jgi:tetratricopeptide (TPR) repeat protein
MFALSRHRFGEAIDIIRGALAVDPWSGRLHGRLGWACHLAGDEAGSLETIESGLLRFPDHEGVLFYAAAILAYNGQAARAIAMANQLARRLPYFDIAGSVQAYALARAGRADEARAVLERLQWLGRERYVLTTFSAAAYVALGETEMALAELRTAEKARCPWFFQTLADPRLESLRQHPEFQSMQNLLATMESAADSDDTQMLPGE